MPAVIANMILQRKRRGAWQSCAAACEDSRGPRLIPSGHDNSGYRTLLARVHNVFVLPEQSGTCRKLFLLHPHSLGIQFLALEEVLDRDGILTPPNPVGNADQQHLGPP